MDKQVSLWLTALSLNRFFPCQNSFVVRNLVVASRYSPTPKISNIMHTKRQRDLPEKTLSPISGCFSNRVIVHLLHIAEQLPRTHPVSCRTCGVRLYQSSICMTDEMGRWHMSRFKIYTAAFPIEATQPSMKTPTLTVDFISG